MKSVVATGSGVAVLAATAGGAMAAERPPSEPEPTGPDSGYRETQHIRDYYRTAAL